MGGHTKGIDKEDTIASVETIFDGGGVGKTGGTLTVEAITTARGSQLQVWCCGNGVCRPLKSQN